MISIRESISDLERSHQARALAVECYRNAIQCVAQYVVEVDRDITQPHKEYLTALAATIAPGSDDLLQESRASLRGLLRDYREKASQHLSNLHDELARNARALEEIMESMALADGDHGTRVRAAIGRLREASGLPDAGVMRAVVQSSASNLEKSLEEMQKHQQLTVAQFQVEIRMLHKRIDSLETAASIDSLTKLFNRAQMEVRIRSMDREFSLLMIRMSGLRRAETAFDADVAGELAGAFTKRLRNSLPPTAVIGRWDHEQFLAIVPAAKTEALTTAHWITENLSGSYACLQNGKTVRPMLQLSVGVIEHGGDSSKRVIELVAEFFLAG